MGVISLPVMLKHNYKKTLSTGVICASGTLGQIIPPSIVLIILNRAQHSDNERNWRHNGFGNFEVFLGFA
jgi:TRAP-type mannitol/chloroaromatic compound transport system permease large subunit